MERIAVRLKEVGGCHADGDEIGSICSVIGAVWAGAKAMTATSGPVSASCRRRSATRLLQRPSGDRGCAESRTRTGQARGWEAGITCRPSGAHTGITKSSLSLLVRAGDVRPAIEAFNLAEQYRVPVFLMAEEAVGHLRERMDVKPEVKVVNRGKKKGAPPFGLLRTTVCRPCRLSARAKTFWSLAQPTMRWVSGRRMTGKP